MGYLFVMPMIVFLFSLTVLEFDCSQRGSSWADATTWWLSLGSPKDPSGTHLW